MKNVFTRLFTGVLYIAVIVGAVMAGGWWLWGLAVLFGVLGVNEFNRISNKGHISNTSRLIDIIGAFFLISGIACFLNLSLPSFMFGAWSLKTFLFAYLVYLMARLVSQLYIQDGNALSHYANSLMGQLYIALPMGLMCALYAMTNCWFVLGMFILIWLSDTGAFCVGSLIGKHKLFERISPKKSWEGFFGGLAFCLAAALCYHFFGKGLGVGLNLWQMLGFGAIVCVFGTWGDLVESLINRTHGVKDYGNHQPRHGGKHDPIKSHQLLTTAVLANLMAVTSF